LCKISRLGCKTGLVPVDLFLVAVLLGKDAAAILLHVEAKLPGPLVSLPEIGTEIPVEERDAVPLRGGAGGCGDGLVVLVGAGKQGGGESGKAVLCGVAGGLLQPVTVAVAAAVVDVSGHMLHKFPQTVVLLDTDLHADGGGVFQQAVPPGLVFFPGVDIGVIPECHRLDALGAQWLDAAERAGSAAAVQQDLIHE
jgi:hypothetical protein